MDQCQENVFVYVIRYCYIFSKYEALHNSILGLQSRDKTAVFVVNTMIFFSKTLYENTV